MSKPVIEGRIYVGNVDFTTTEQELQNFFEGLKVESVEIPSKTITRGGKTIIKRLGFGFVQFATDADADKAIEEFNGKALKSRHIYAKKALPPATEEEKQKKAEAYFAKREQQKARREAKKAQKPELVKKEEPAENGTESKEKANGEVIRKEQDESKTPEGTKSKTTVFITNLEYKVTLLVLHGIFKDLEPNWIHVPTKRVPRHMLKRFRAKNKPLFNKGYAFAKFPTEDNQQKAIAQFNGHEVNGRAIIVEAAVDRPGIEEEPKEETEEA